MNSPPSIRNTPSLRPFSCVVKATMSPDANITVPINRTESNSPTDIQYGCFSSKFRKMKDKIYASSCYVQVIGSPFGCYRHIKRSHNGDL